VLTYKGDKGVFQLYKPEACFYLAFVEVNLRNNKGSSLELIRMFEQDSSLFQYRASPLIIFARSSINMKNGRNNEAIAILSDFKPGPKTSPFLYLHYLEGLARLNRLDSTASGKFRLFLENYNGINYIKSGYQKLAWNALMQGDTAGYSAEIEMAGSVGNTIIDEDKQAYAEYEMKDIPAIPLLKARLLYDGGYYHESLDVLLNTPLAGYIRNRKDLTEYTYRSGRVYHAIGDIPKAIEYYSEAIRYGMELPHYFAANSALNLGYIYESMGNFAEAGTNYSLCISLKHHEYENSLRQKAKAGLNRIKKAEQP